MTIGITEPEFLVEVAHAGTRGPLDLGSGPLNFEDSQEGTELIDSWRRWPRARH